MGEELLCVALDHYFVDRLLVRLGLECSIEIFSMLNEPFLGFDRWWFKVVRWTIGKTDIGEVQSFID